MNSLLQTLRDTYAVNPAKALNMIPEICKAIDEGLIIELPCSTGTTIYKSIQTPRTGTEAVGIMPMTGIDIIPKQFELSDIGSEFYLTREAAEEKLEEKS